jgi:hypothetical protein
VTLAQLSWIGRWLPWVPIGIVVIGGLWALWLIGRPPRRERRDRSTALRLSGILALVAAGGVLFLAAALGNAFGGSAGAGIVAGIPIAAGAAGLVFLSGISVYALLARPRVGMPALVGTLVGPLVLGGVVSLANDWQKQASSARYGFLHVTIDAVEHRGVAGGSVQGPVRMQVTVLADYGFTWTTSESGHRSPRFRLSAVGDSDLCAVELEAPAASATRFEPGAPVRYSLEFPLRQTDGTAACRWARGPWWLSVLGTGLLDGDTIPDSHIVQTRLEVAPA